MAEATHNPGTAVASSRARVRKNVTGEAIERLSGPNAARSPRELHAFTLSSHAVPRTWQLFSRAIEEEHDGQLGSSGPRPHAQGLRVCNTDGAMLARGTTPS